MSGGEPDPTVVSVGAADVVPGLLLLLLVPMVVVVIGGGGVLPVVDAAAGGGSGPKRFTAARITSSSRPGYLASCSATFGTQLG